MICLAQMLSAEMLRGATRGPAVHTLVHMSIVRRRFIGMVKVSFGMLFDCVTLSSKHMLQVRCSSVEIKPSMNITHRGTAQWASLRGLRRQQDESVAVEVDCILEVQHMLDCHHLGIFILIHKTA